MNATSFTDDSFHQFLAEKKVVQTSRNHENTFNSELLSHFTLDSNPVRNFMCLDWRRTASLSRLAAALMICSKEKTAFAST